MSVAADSLTTFFHQFPASGYSKNQVIISAGNQCDFFYYVEEGAVKMTTTSRTGKNLILHTFFPHSFFSLLSLVTENTSEYDFVSIQPTTLRKVPRSELIVFLKDHSDILWELQLRLLKGLNGLLKRIEQSASTPAYSQVASLLLYFSEHSSTMVPKVTHQEIADWLGLSRENVSLQMEKLEKDGLIANKKDVIEIKNVAALQSIAQALTL